MKSLFYSAVISLFFIGPAGQAQEFLSSEMSGNIHDINANFEKYFSDMPPERHKSGLKQWHRWKHFWEYRVDSSGNLPAPNAKEMEMSRYRLQQQKDGSDRLLSSVQWRPLGPTTLPPNISNFPGEGLGRVNAIAFHPTNNSTMWVGSAGGGVWRTTNGGTTWRQLTDSIGVLSVGDIAVHPTQPSTLYVGTGDAFGLFTVASGGNGLGIFRSDDGGDTWRTTGFSFGRQQGHTVRRILINPQRPTELLVAANNGIWHSTDEGRTWQRRLQGNMFALEYHPSTPQIVYTTSFQSSSESAAIHVSTDGGLTWGSRLAPPNGQRIALGVSPAAPNTVYAVASDRRNSGLLGVYRSTNSGQSWQTVATSPNILGRDPQGSDEGGQGWWDLALAVSPTNANQVFVGGINIWRSDDGGSRWVVVGRGDDRNNYIHYDHHSLRFQNSTGTLFACHDGGVDRTRNAGARWENISSGLAINQVYRFDFSTQFPEIIIAGSQDNGFNRRFSGRWEFVWGGDGMECIINPDNWRQQFIANQFGMLWRSENNGNSWQRIGPNAGNGEWITPFFMNPLNSLSLYAAYNRVFKSTNSGNSWQPISPDFFGSPLAHVTIAPSDTMTLYASQAASFLRTTNGGADWQNLTASVPLRGARISSITVHPHNSQHVFVTYSLFQNLNVWESTDGGTTWTSIGESLPAIPVNNLAIAAGARTHYYAATDDGVYVYDTNIGLWLPFSNGLPRGLVITQIKLNQADRTVRLGSMGRGIWEAPMYSTPQIETRFQASNGGNVCVGGRVTFINTSNNPLATAQWNFPGGEPSTATGDTVEVLYRQSGFFSVTLTTAGPAGTFTNSSPDAVQVYAQPAPVIIANGQVPISTLSLCRGDTILLQTSEFSRYRWSTGDTLPVLAVTASGEYFLTATNIIGCEGTSDIISVEVTDLPEPLIVVEEQLVRLLNGGDFPENTTFRWRRNGEIVAGASADTLVAELAGEYAIEVEWEQCTVVSRPTTVTSINEIPTASVELTSRGNFNEGSGRIIIATADAKETIRGELLLYDLKGKEILRQQVVATGRFQTEAPKLLPGAYIAVFTQNNIVQTSLKILANP